MGIGRLTGRSHRVDIEPHVPIQRGRHRAFNKERPHQGIDDRVPSAVRTGQPPPDAAVGPVGNTHCEQYLGGLLKSYHRVAA